MHGLTSPEALRDSVDVPPRRRPLAGALDWLRARRMFLMIVLLPTALVALYYGAIASRQYVSEAHFVVRAAGVSQGPTSGLSQLLGMSTAFSPSQTESLGLGDYLTSHDAVEALDRDLDLVAIFRRDGADPLSRLKAAPTPETLLKYYRRQVDLDYNSETGITTMKVRTFRPADSLTIARTLLELGERRVNLLNKRAYDDALAVSQRQLDAAEAEMSSVQQRMTGYRQRTRDIDPQRSSAARIELVSALQGQLAAARAQLATMGAAVDRSSPQYVAMATRVRALAAQVSAEAGQLAGGSGTMAAGLGQYEELQLRQDFAAKRYAAAAAGLQSAREQAVRQQLFVVRVVEPNLPVKSLYPQPWKIIVGVFLGLMLAYGIGWLIVAGVKEHAA